MRLFKQKILSLVTAVCMIATSAAPVFAAEGDTPTTTDSGSITVTWEGSVTSVKVTLDSGDPTTEKTFSKNGDKQDNLPIGDYLVEVTTPTSVISVKVKDDTDYTSTVSSGSKVWTKDGTKYPLEKDKDLALHVVAESGGGGDTTTAIDSVQIQKDGTEVSGTEVIVGDTLTGVALDDQSQAISTGVTYQWKSSGTENGTFENIGNATNATYTPDNTMINQWILVEANGNGTTVTGTNKKSAAVQVKAKTFTARLSNDTPSVKDKLSVTLTPTDATANYAWSQSATADGTFEPIPNEESKDLDLASYANKFIRVTVTGTDDYQGEETVLTTTKAVAAVPAEDKVITSFKTSDLTLDKDLHLTTFAMVENAYPAYFSKTVTGTCDDGSTVPVPVTSWDCTSYTSAKGDYTAVAALEVPNGYVLEAGVTATVKINVTEAQTAEKIITAFDSIDGVSGGKVGAIASGYEPDKVAATLLTAHKNVSATVDGQTVTIPVISWNCSNYDVTKADTYTFTATLNMAGYKLQDGVPAPTIKVTIAAKDKITLQEVEKPTVTLNSDEHLNTWALLTASGKLPKTVKLTGTKGETANAGVSWTEPAAFNYTGAVTDGLSISGTFALPSDWDNTAAALTTTLTLVVKVEQTTSTDGKTPVSTLNIRIDNPISGAEISTWGIGVEASVTGDFSWNPKHTKFQAGTRYTLTATLTANDGYKFTDATTVNIIDGNSKTSSMSVSNRTDTSSLTCSYTFPAVEAKYVTVTFMDDGKTYATQQVKENTILTSVPADPTKTAHTFIGWFTTNDEKGVQFDFGTAFKADMTLYAKFAPEVNEAQKEALKDAVQANDSTQAATAVEAIQDAANGDPAAVKEIIEKSGLSKNDIKKLEGLYADGANITTEGKSTANALPSGASVEVEGGELNVPADATSKKVVIEVADARIQPEDMESALKATGVTMDTAKVVPLDITLKIDGTEQSTSVTPITITMPLPTGIDSAKPVYVIHILKNGQIESIRTDVKDGKISFTVSNFSDFIVANATQNIDPGPGPGPGPNPNPKPDNGNNNSGGSGGSGGGGGGGSSGSNKSQSIFQRTTSTINNILKGWFGGVSRRTTTSATGAAAVTGTPVTESAAAKAASSAASQAKAQGSNSFNAIVRNATTVSPKAFEAVASQAQKSGLKGYLAADTMKNGAVDVRVSVLASAASRLGKELNLYAVCGNPAIEKHFNKYFSNKTAVISMSQKGSFGVTVNVAAKVNLNGMDVKNLHIYSYDVASNSYRELPQEACFVDGNGYLHFTTDMGGYIVISDGVLTLH